METGLEDKCVLITGGSGGIGAACARAFTAEGSRVAIHFHRGEERAKTLAAELPGSFAVQADLTREDEADRLFTTVRRSLGNIDVCASVVGVRSKDSIPIWDLPLSRWEDTMHLNLRAAFLTARGFFQGVRETGRGNLILIGSTAGLFGEAGHADYAAAKSAIMYGFVLSLKNEIVQIAPRGRINAVCPGWTETPTRSTLDDPAVLARATRTMALQKVARPEDIAHQVVVLASDEISGHVTGQITVVAGGMEGRVLHDQ